MAVFGVVGDEVFHGVGCDQGVRFHARWLVSPLRLRWVKATVTVPWSGQAAARVARVGELVAVRLARTIVGPNKGG